MQETRACIQRYFDARLLENIAIRVGTADRVLFDSYRSKSDPIDDKTLFDMASVTKIVVTTTLTLMALDRKLLRLEDPVGKYLPCPPDRADLTIRHLLTHTIGFGYRDLRQAGYTYDNIEAYIFSLPREVPLGADVRYCCSAFILLGKILERVFGKRLNEAFRELVAEPLEMRDTTYLPERNRSFVNSNLSEAEKGIVNCHNGRFLGGVTGQAGLFSNLSDMTRYAKLLLAHGAPLISREWFDRAIENQTAGMSEARGLGFVYVDERYPQTGSLFSPGSIGHCGHTGQSLFVDLKSGLYVTILSDATISTVRTYGSEHYDEVMQLREELHNAIKADLLSRGQLV